MKSVLTALCKDTRGTTTIEYACILGMIVLAILASIRGLGSENGGLWGNISTKAITASQQAAG